VVTSNARGSWLHALRLLILKDAAFWPFFLSRFPLGHEEGRHVSRKPNPRTKLKIHEVCWIWFPPVIMSVYSERVSSHTMNRARDKMAQAAQRPPPPALGRHSWALHLDVVERGSREDFGEVSRVSKRKRASMCPMRAEKRDDLQCARSCLPYPSLPCIDITDTLDSLLTNPSLFPACFPACVFVHPHQMPAQP
jgi:hypothetical protein